MIAYCKEISPNPISQGIVKYNSGRVNFRYFFGPWEKKLKFAWVIIFFGIGWIGSEGFFYERIIAIVPIDSVLTVNYLGHTCRRFP